MRARPSRAISRPRRPFCATRRGWVGALRRGGPSCPPRLGTAGAPVAPPAAVPPSVPRCGAGSLRPLPPPAFGARSSPRRGRACGARLVSVVVPCFPCRPAAFVCAPAVSVGVPPGGPAAPSPSLLCRSGRARLRLSPGPACGFGLWGCAPGLLPRGGSRPLRGLGGRRSSPPRVGLVLRGCGAARVRPLRVLSGSAPPYSGRRQCYYILRRLVYARLRCRQP